MRLSHAAFFVALALPGCGDEDVNPVAKPPEGYAATLRRSSFGIPHITASDRGSLAFGMAYAAAQDHVCTIADQIVKVRSERAITFGRGEEDANVSSDFAYLALGVYENGAAFLQAQSPEMREIVLGYVAGYNHYLAQTPPEALPAPCASASWVKPITGDDLSAYYADLTLRGSSIPFLDYVGGATPPNAAPTGGRLPPDQVPDFGRNREGALGSNGWAIGKGRSAEGGGMLLANPHFPWEGELRFHESHLTIPGEVDVYGASLIGAPVINIGFNRHVAWTHTVTPANHFTVYQLELTPGDPTSYLYDGAPRAMTSKTVSVEILEEDGSTTTEERTYWRSHYGPMVTVPGALPWTEKVAFTYRDANETNGGIGEQWMRMNRAESLDEIKQIHGDVQGIPWVFTIATDTEGNAMVADGSRVPKLSAETEQAYLDALAEGGLTRTLADNGVVLLDGTTSRDEWVEGDNPNAPGLVPFAEAPQVVRSDFAMNANDTIWLANPEEPLEGYSILYGEPRTPSSPRTRMNLITLSETGVGSPAGDDGKFTLEELQAAALSNRSVVAEDLRADVVTRCQASPAVDLDGVAVDLTEACSVLSAWDGRFDKDRAGAILWREMLGGLGYAAVADAGKLYAEPFDPDDPVRTPHGLAPAPAGEPDPVLVALAKGVQSLEEAGLAVDATLGDAQFTWKNDVKIPLHGGNSLEGVTNIITWGKNNSTLLPGVPRGEVVQSATNLTEDGYVINYGTSFIMTLELTPDGPRGAAMISYSESGDPASSHHADQTERFSDKGFRPILFEEADIAADPELTTL